jgi:hypothetical protein
MNKMISIVKNKLIANLPSELTENAIRQHFPTTCLQCSIGNIQKVPNPLSAIHNDSVPIGSSFSVDYKKMSGPNNDNLVTSYGGYTHYFVAIDYQSGRAITRATKGSKAVVDDLEYLYGYNKAKGYCLLNITIDSEFATK